MITLDLNEGLCPSFLDSSNFATFRRCPARYCFRAVLGLCTREPRPPLDYGTSLHTAIPYAQKDQLDKSLAVFAEVWNSYGHEPCSKRNLFNATKMITNWHRQRITEGNRPYTILPPPQGALEPSTKHSDDEFAFAFDIDGTLPMVGRIDAVGVHTVGGNLWNVEYKTTSELGSRFAGLFELNSQIMTYAIATKLFFPSREFGGSFVEAFRVTSANPDCALIPVLFDDWTLEAHLSTFAHTTRLVSDMFESRSWPQDFSACTTYPQHGSPGYRCEFIPLCKSPDWRRIREMFKIEYWKPFKELKGIEK